MTMDAIYEQHESDWSYQVSAVATTRCLQHDQILLSAKDVACETKSVSVCEKTHYQLVEATASLCRGSEHR